MKKLIFCAMIFLAIPGMLIGQTINVGKLKQVNLPEKIYVLKPKLDPTGKYLAFELIISKNSYLFINHIKSSKIIQLPNCNVMKIEDFKNLNQKKRGIFRRSNSVVTADLQWFYEKEGGGWYVDFIHTPRPGQFNLYHMYSDLNFSEHNSLEKKKLYITSFNEFRKYQYPVFSNLSPNGTPKVIFTYMKNLYEFNHAQNDRAREITRTQSGVLDLSAKYSPDDKFIVFAREHDHYSNLFLMDLSKKIGSEKMIVKSKAINCSPEWSPDGTKIAYFSDEEHSKTFSIWIYDIVRGVRREIIKEVVRNVSLNSGPVWLNNESILYISSDIDKRQPIMYYNLNSKLSIQLNTNTDLNLELSAVPISDSTYRIAFTSRGKKESGSDLIWSKLFITDIEIN